ncbi:MAG TPA: hypothetical protein VGZ22_16130 [Isosphaeraceae bacterium]|jgi:hypothetical protein|nr:hypothetical protein [Isosphaeraceae bacterium]
MSKSKKFSLLGAGAVLVAASLAFQSKGILFPDWSKPTKGTYATPSAEIGKKAQAAQPWSVTTVTSSIEGKTLPGKPVSLVGEIIDLSCYLQVGKHGDKHRDCGQKCARNGQPVGLLLQDGTVYTLIDEEHDQRRDGLTTFRQQAVDNMANIVTVNGTLSEVEGQKAIYVQGTVKGK